MQQLIRTKRNLSLTFLSIILGIIFLLGASFLCIKFFDGERKDAQEIQMVSQKIQSDNFSSGTLNFLTSPPPFSLTKWPKDIQDVQWELPSGKDIQRERIPFSIVVFDEEWAIIKKYIVGRYIDEAELTSFFQLKWKGWPFYDDDMVYQFLPEKDSSNTILILKPLRYSVSDFLFDALLFFVVMLTFSFPLFFIIRYLVSRTMKPVEENMRDMQDFIHNAGHELKTPLAVMHGNLQIAAELKSFDAVLNKEMISEIEKMNQLIEWLIELSNISTGIEEVKIVVDQEVRQIVETFDSKVQEKSLTCKIEKHSSLEISANKGYFYILFSNLFLNALKYNVRGGNIDIVIKKSSLEIRDTGIGIEKEFHEKIFQRFFKVDNSRNTAGFWIWLSLVKKVAEIYNWKITVKSEKWKGTSFEIFF